MKKSVYLLIVSSFLLAASCASIAYASERVYLDITTTETRKIKFAVPWFTNKEFSGQKQKLGKQLADTLAKALKFHGIISIIPTSSYGGLQNTNWKKLGCDYTVLGQYSISGQALNLEIRLLDIAGNEMVMGKSFRGSTNQKEKMLFKFCDTVIETLTGTPGIADSRIAFVNRHNGVKEVYLTNILGSKVRQVTRHKHLAVSPRFVPGGSYLSYSSYHTGSQNLYITDLSQSKTTRALSRRKGLNMAPAWSADGRKMILTLSKNGSPDLYILDRRGHILEQLTMKSGINVSPAWSPDEKWVVFVSDRSGKPQLYLMELATRKTRRLTFEGTENAEPDWSPTENKIVYSSLRNGVYQLFTMNPFIQEEPRQLTSDLSHHESPNWSPDGNQIIFAKRDGKKKQIYGILKNGQYQRRLFSLPGSQSSPEWAR